ncbi:MAG: hypothetical protein ACR2FY_02760 [Pirellulaceae bacterium]
MVFTSYRRSAIFLGAALVLTVWIGSVRADKPTRIPAFYDGRLVSLAIVNDNVVGVEREAIEGIAEPLYAIAGQPHVISTMPGQPGYNPYWDIYVVVVLDGRNVSTDPFLSEEEILDAEDAGEIKIIRLDLILLCQVISK